jgi:hypothetical protein
MNSNNLLEFTSKECILNAHQKCAREWEGIGIKALCKCKCHYAFDESLSSDKN